MYSTPVILVSIFVAICESLWTRVRGISLAAYRFLATISRQIATLPPLPISLPPGKNFYFWTSNFQSDAAMPAIYKIQSLFTKVGWPEEPLKR